MNIHTYLQEEIEINNNTGLIQNTINNLFEQLLISNIYYRRDIIIYGKNISIIVFRYIQCSSINDK